MEQQDCQPEVIMPLVEDALRQTYGKSDIKLTDHTALIFEEAELFHTMARTYKRLGNLPEAIKILQSLECSISKLPTWDKDREKQQIPVLLTLAQCQLQAQQYEIAIQTCIRGFDYSATRSQGLYAPDFMYLQAQALFALQRDGYAPLLRNAYFCYTMLHKKAAEGLLREASDKMGVTINTYGVDALIYAPRVKATYERGALSNYKDIGEMLKSLRKKARLTLAELSKGICSIANLQKIESGAIQGKMKYIEPLMQRLGRDVHLYCPFYLKRSNFLNAQMKENIHMLQVTGDYNKANELVNILKKKDEFKKYIGLQFIKRVEALNYYAIQKKISPIYLNMLTDALKITCPQFNEQNIDQYSLTHDEIIIISAIATYYVDTSNNERAANIYKNLLINMQETYVDEAEKARMYATILYNYSRCLGRMGRRKEALDYINEGLNFERNNERLKLLPELLFNKAYNLYELGMKEESLPYFAQAYYGVTTLLKLGMGEHQRIIKEEILKRFSINFD